jgi:hypothetical protein
MKTDKFCPRCQLTKPIDEFQRAANRGDGHDAYCRLCRNAWKREKRRTPKYRETARLYNHKQSRSAWAAEYKKRPEVIARKREVAAKMREIYPERFAARYTVKNAVRDGKLPPLRECECRFAGPDCKGRMEYHHYKGYDQKHWLTVIPVCANHHELLEMGRIKL